MCNNFFFIFSIIVFLFKTQTVFSSNLIYDVNNIEVKSSSKVEIGNKISIKKKGIAYEYKVKKLLDKRVGAKLVNEYIEDITTQEELVKLKIQLSMKKEYRKKPPLQQNTTTTKGRCNISREDGVLRNPQGEGSQHSDVSF